MFGWRYTERLGQDSSNLIANVLELLQYRHRYYGNELPPFWHFLIQSPQASFTKTNYLNYYYIHLYRDYLLEENYSINIRFCKND